MTVGVKPLRQRTSTWRIDLTRLMPSVLLTGYGALILSLYARNELTLYINPTYVGPTAIAGLTLIALSALRLRNVSLSSCRCETGCEPGESSGSAHESPRFALYAFLAIPLLLGLIFPPRSLASFSATQRGPQIAGLTAFHGSGTVHHVSLSVDTASFGLQDWAGALSADPNPKDYQGKVINLSGLILHDRANVPPGYLMVLRYQVTCCIADARPVGLIVQDTSRGTLKDGQWITLHGTMGATHFQGQQIAVVIPKQMVPTRPGNPYMY